MKQNQPNKDIFQITGPVWRKKKDNERSEDEHPCDNYHHEKCFCKGACSCHWMKYEDVEFWSGTEDDLDLHCKDIDEAIEEYLDNLDELKGMITMFGYRMLNVHCGVYNPLERILEELDEEYGNPNGNITKATYKMKKAEEKFLNVIEKEYKSWACEDICTAEIDVRDWVKENRPDWLEEKEK